MQIGVRRDGIPWAMAAGRALLGPLMIVGERCGWSGFGLAAMVMAALLSDIFDGVLARRWACDTAAVRLFDTIADTIFYLGAGIALWLGRPEIVRENGGLVAGLLGLELARWALEFWKFGKPASYHSYLAKCWGLVLAAGIVTAFAVQRNTVVLKLGLALGIVSNLEGLAMSLVLPVWRRDVKTLWAAWTLRAGMVGPDHARVKKLVLAIMLCGLTCLGWSRVANPLYRKKLAKPTEMRGYRCAEGYAWFYSNGVPEGCTVARDTDFGVARIPAGSGINLTLEGKPKSVFLKHDTDIAGYRCRGGNWLLGPSEGAITLFYPSGNLELCWLVGERQVQGVPCSGSNMFSGDSGVMLYENGRLHSCKLSKDYGNVKRGQRFSQ